MLSLQKISKSAAKGYAEYIEEQKQEVNERMAMDPTLNRADVERQVAREMVARVAKRDGEDIAEAHRQFDKREDLAQVGAQASYYSIDPNEKIEGDRLTHIVGERAGKEVESGELLDILMSRDGDGKRLHDPQHKALKSLLDEVGIVGVPTPEQRDALRSGVHPGTGEDLTGMAATKQARAYAEGGLREDSVTGIDMTFSCPKSLSIVAAAAAASGDTETYEAILTDVRNAVSATLGRADNEGLILGRRGEDGIDKVRAHLTNAVAKIETGSRSHDPQIHVHTVLSTVVVDDDGKRSRIDAQKLFHASKYLGSAFRRNLAWRLENNEKLGLKLEVDELGMHELVGFDEDLIQKFSTRSQQIAETLSEMDAEDERVRNVVAAAEDAHVAAYEKQKQAVAEATEAKGARLTAKEETNAVSGALTTTERQQAKTYGKLLQLKAKTEASRRQDAVLQSRVGKEGTEAELIEEWKQNEALTADVVTQAKKASAKHTREEMTQEQLFEFVAARLTEGEGKQEFSEKEARIAVDQFAPASWHADRVHAAANQFLDSADHVLCVQQDEMQEQKLGSWVNDARRWTTHQVVKKQERIMTLALDISMRTNRLDLDLANLAELSESYTLTDEQADFAAAVASTNFTMARGYAGTGKSQALKPIVEELQRAGYDVSTFGVKKNDSIELSREVGANRGESLDKLLMLQEETGAKGLIESGYWAQGEPDDVREERRAIERRIRVATNRAREAQETGDEKLLAKAENVRAKAEKHLEQFKKERAKDPTAKEIKGDQREQAWLYHAADALIPYGAARNATMGHLANSRDNVAERSRYAADKNVQIDWDKPMCWIIDEAALLDDEKLSRIMEHAHEHNIKLIFLGDRQQGKAIGVSGAYTRMEDTYGTVDLTEIYRAKATWEKDIQKRIHDLPQGKDEAKAAAEEIVAEYEDHGRIQYVTNNDVQAAVARGDADAADVRTAKNLAADKAADWWMSHRHSEGTSSVQTATRAEQAQVATAIQKKLMEAGELDPNAKKVEFSLDGSDENKVSLRVGEPVLIRSNLNKKGLQNGMSGQVTALHADGSVKVRVRKGDTSIEQTLSSKEVQEDATLAPLYSATIAKNQGATFDRAAVLMPGDGGMLSKGDFYTAMSRGRVENTAIMPTMGDEESARKRVIQTVQNRQEDEVLRADYVNSPATQEELDRELGYGVTDLKTALRNIKQERRITLRKQQEKQAKDTALRSRHEAQAARRLRREREAVRQQQAKKGTRRGMSVAA